MAKPKYQRRKEDRPDQITEAALAVFSKKGYAATRVDDVARCAGVSKGLLYLYFKTKEELFKAVIRSFFVPRIDALKTTMESSDLSAEDFLRGPFVDFAVKLVNSPAKHLIRLFIADGPKHPDLIAYHWDKVVSQALELLRGLIARGVRDGEFRQSALQEFPQLLVSPVLFSAVWTIVFEAHHQLDIRRFISAHIDLVLYAIKADTERGTQS